MLNYFKKLLKSEEGSVGADFIMMLAVFAVLIQAVIKAFKKASSWCSQSYFEELNSGKSKTINSILEEQDKQKGLL